MKLFCSSKLQKKLRCKCEKVPTPEDPLDRWYANLIDLHDEDLIAVVLPDFRFCALVWGVSVDRTTDLTKLLVPAIRKALRDPYFGIPQSVVDQYMPEDAVFELCATGDSKLVNGMGAATKDVQYSSEYYFSYFDGLDVEKAQRRVNISFQPRDSKEDKLQHRWEAVKELLMQRYGRGVPAMELTALLDLQETAVLRTLIVPDDIPFDVLHAYLKAAFQWDNDGIHQFILPPMEDRHAPLHIFGPLAELNRLPEGDHYLWGEDVLLSEQLQEGDLFQYLYHPHSSKKPWEVDIQVRRCIPSATEDLPVCTRCVGRAPERADSVEDYLAVRKVLQNPKHPKFWDYMSLSALEWIAPDRADLVTSRMHSACRLQ